MNDMQRDDLDKYYAEAETWSADRRRADGRSRRIAWLVAGVAGAIALLEALALFLLVPLKREVPFTLLVDRQTGHVETLRPLDESTISPDSALTRSFLAQYVVAREGFDAATVQADYRKVGLMSADEARTRYLAQMQSGDPANPLVALPRSSTVDVRIRSVSSLSRDTAMVRFDTLRTDLGGQPQVAQNWAAVIVYRYNQGGMSEADRLDNPLGFQVVRYRKDPETLPEAVPVSGSPAGEPPAVTYPVRQGAPQR